MIVSYGQLEEARRATAGLPFAFTFDPTPDGFEFEASGVVAGHHFKSASRRFGLAHGIQPAGTNPVLAVVEELEKGLRSTADHFHRATPWPIWTDAQESAMSYKERVDAALDEYKGSSPVGLSLGPDRWSGFLQQTSLRPDESGRVEYRGVRISVGISAIEYVFED